MNGRYIQTPIGKIPEEWQVVRLSDEGICEIRRRKQKKMEEDVPFIPMGLISDYKIFAEYEMRKQKDVKSYTYCEAGDLLLAKITPSLENGKQGIVPLNIPSGFALATTEVFPILCKGIEKLFLFYILKYPKFRKVLERSMTGTTGRQRVSIRAVKRLRIPLPPIEEQKRIAEVLSCIDDAIQMADEGITKTERLKKGLMQTLFTEGIGHKEFKQSKIGKIPKKWTIKTLSNVFKLSSGKPRPSKIFDRISKEAPFPIYGGNGVLGYSDKFLLDRETIAIGRVGEYCGSIYKTQQFAWITDNALYVLELSKDYNITFLTFLLTYLNLNRFKLKMGQSLITQTIIYAINVPSPSLSEQLKIAKILTVIDERLELITKKKEQFERIKRGLMNDLLTGKRRVKVAM